MEKLKVNSGDHIALLYPPGIELIVAFYGCLYVGKSDHRLGHGRSGLVLEVKGGSGLVLGVKGGSGLVTESRAVVVWFQGSRAVVVWLQRSRAVVVW